MALLSANIGTNFLIALQIMGKGMLGIFTVIIIISLIVALIGRIGSSKK